MTCTAMRKTQYRVTINGQVRYVYTAPQSASKYKDRILQVWGLETQWVVVDSNPQGVYTHIFDLIEMLEPDLSHEDRVAKFDGAAA